MNTLHTAASQHGLHLRPFGRDLPLIPLIYQTVNDRRAIGTDQRLQAEQCHAEHQHELGHNADQHHNASSDDSTTACQQRYDQNYLAAHHEHKHNVMVAEEQDQDQAAHAYVESAYCRGQIDAEKAFLADEFNHLRAMRERQFEQ